MVEHTDSIASQDPARDEPKKTKSRRPPSKLRPGKHECAQRMAVLTDNRYGIQTAAVKGMAVRAERVRSEKDGD
jgi:hypothetical protein